MNVPVELYDQICITPINEKALCSIKKNSNEAKFKYYNYEDVVNDLPFNKKAKFYAVSYPVRQSAISNNIPVLVIKTSMNELSWIIEDNNEDIIKNFLESITKNLK